VAAEVPADAQRAGARESQRHPGAAAAGRACGERRGVQAERRHVRERVHGADAPHAVARRLGVGPVREAGDSGRRRGEDADGDEAIGAPAPGATADEVEDRRRRPGADGHVSEQWMQTVAEPRPAERVLDGSARDRRAHELADGLGRRVEDAELAEALGEGVQGRTGGGAHEPGGYPR
jgi:hypothetical protein